MLDSYGRLSLLMTLILGLGFAIGFRLGLVALALHLHVGPKRSFAKIVYLQYQNRYCNFCQVENKCFVFSNSTMFFPL